MVNDAILTTPDTQEALSRAYVEAVAAAAGYSTARPEIDRDSIDVTISAGGSMRPRIDIQLKATTNLKSRDGIYRFRLSIKNYNDLRAETQTPRILVILNMPSSPKEWLNITSEALVLRHAAYWKSMRNAPETENTSSVSIDVPSANVFDVSGLKELMEKSRSGVVV